MSRESIKQALDLLKDWSPEAAIEARNQLNVLSQVYEEIPAHVLGKSTNAVREPLGSYINNMESWYEGMQRLYSLFNSPVLVVLTEGVVMRSSEAQNDEWRLLSSEIEEYLVVGDQIKTNGGSAEIILEQQTFPLHSNMIYQFAYEDPLFLYSISISEYPYPPLVADGKVYERPSSLPEDFFAYFGEAIVNSSRQWNDASYYAVDTILRADTFLPFDQLLRDLFGRGEETWVDGLKRGLGDVLAWILDNFLDTAPQALRDFFDDASILVRLYEENPEATMLSLQEFGRQNPEFQPFVIAATAALSPAAGGAGGGAGFSFGILLIVMVGGVALAYAGIKAWIIYREAESQNDSQVFSSSDDESLNFPSNIPKAIRSLEKKIREHMQKLQEYLADPDAYDNKGLLEQAGEDLELRQAIIEGRVEHLQDEINNWTKQIEKLREELERRNQDDAE